MVQLNVDSEIRHVVGPVNPQSTDTGKAVFIGGAPGETSAPDFVPSHQSHTFTHGFFHPLRPLPARQPCHQEALRGLREESEHQQQPSRFPQSGSGQWSCERGNLSSSMSPSSSALTKHALDTDKVISALFILPGYCFCYLLIFLLLH